VREWGGGGYLNHIVSKDIKIILIQSQFINSVERDREGGGVKQGGDDDKQTCQFL
jgi:hypothetical protein